jgi:hypothetical protein
VSARAGWPLVTIPFILLRRRRAHHHGLACIWLTRRWQRPQAQPIRPKYVSQKPQNLTDGIVADYRLYGEEIGLVRQEMLASYGCVW